MQLSDVHEFVQARYGAIAESRTSCCGPTAGAADCCGALVSNFAPDYRGTVIALEE